MKKNQRIKRINLEILQSQDIDTIHTIAEWYLHQWKIPAEKTIQKLTAVAVDKIQFQVVMTINNQPVATGGLYQHVGLLDKEPRFSVYKHWLALVYTLPEKRHQGLGATLCNFIEDTARERGITQMHLFTDTAERLYTRLGWAPLERLSLGERTIVVMYKTL